MFHIVADGRLLGRAWATASGTSCRRGDVVVMPYGDAHAWGSRRAGRAGLDHDPAAAAAHGPEFPHIDYGGDGEMTMVVCGYLRGDAVLFDPVLRALPSLFVVHPPTVRPRPG